MKTSFLELLRSHQNIIHKVCHLYRNSKEDQEDLFQEITLQLWKAFPKFRNEAKPGTWMYRIALNTALSSFQGKKVSIVTQAEFPDHTSVSAPPLASENQVRLFEVLRQLNEADRAVISLYLEAYSHREIAEILGSTENNIGVRMHRIKTKLKTLLN